MGRYTGMDNILPTRLDTVGQPQNAENSASHTQSLKAPEPETSETVSAKKPSSGQPPWFLWCYVIGVSIVSLGILFILFFNGPAKS